MAGLPVPDDWPVLLPAGEPDPLCHNDLAARNLVVDGGRMVFIDWDGAGPSTRLWDLAHAAISFGHLFPGAEPEACAARLTAFLEGYGADPLVRDALPATLARRSRAMYAMLRRAHEAGEQPTRQRPPPSVARCRGGVGDAHEVPPIVVLRPTMAVVALIYLRRNGWASTNLVAAMARAPTRGGGHRCPSGGVSRSQAP